MLIRTRPKRPVFQTPSSSDTPQYSPPRPAPITHAEPPPLHPVPVHPPRTDLLQSSRLYWQSELLALHNLRVVDPEEITVQHRLHQTSQHGDLIQVPIREVAPEPVWDVQRAVRTQRRNVVHGDGVRLACALQHEQLGQDGHALEPDAEAPEDFAHGVFRREEDAQDERAQEKVLYAEGVEGRGLSGLVGCHHQVERVARGGDEEDLEDAVVVAVREGRE
ncbi:hypothetical protein V494_06342 [Pseudogymnoascus sp. VKM F-4513 (FW-928)]|nr:hypothetical protein V494_06342 [Pseudogymnoascus sp. VKM F-4513 (FW-928)]